MNIRPFNLLTDDPLTTMRYLLVASDPNSSAWCTVDLVTVQNWARGESMPNMFRDFDRWWLAMLVKYRVLTKFLFIDWDLWMRRWEDDIYRPNPLYPGGWQHTPSNKSSTHDALQNSMFLAKYGLGSFGHKYPGIVEISGV